MLKISGLHRSRTQLTDCSTSCAAHSYSCSSYFINLCFHQLIRMMFSPLHSWLQSSTITSKNFRTQDKSHCSHGSSAVGLFIQIMFTRWRNSRLGGYNTPPIPMQLNFLKNLISKKTHAERSDTVLQPMTLLLYLILLLLIIVGWTIQM